MYYDLYHVANKSLPNCKGGIKTSKKIKKRIKECDVYFKKQITKMGKYLPF